MLAVPDERWGQRVVALTTAELGLAQVVRATPAAPGPGGPPARVAARDSAGVHLDWQDRPRRWQRDWEAKG
ncbi:MAG: hypothetical protein IPL43_13450 [Micropruina sp.]|nr:hypothetical protein [Micropruina sp.]